MLTETHWERTQREERERKRILKWVLWVVGVLGALVAVTGVVYCGTRPPEKEKKSDRENKEALKRLQPDHQHVQVSVVLSALVYESSEEKRRKAEAIVQKMVYDKRITVIQAYKKILYCRVGDTLYVVSRGTVLSCLSDLTADLTPGFQMDETGSYEACRGFSNSVKQDRLQYDEIFDDMVRRLQENPNLQLVFTGHSLGGAVARLLICIFHQRYSEHDGRTTAYLYGSPHSGGIDMRLYYDREGISRRIFHLTNSDDNIPPLSRVLPSISVPVTSVMTFLSHMVKTGQVKLEIIPRVWLTVGTLGPCKTLDPPVLEGV
ncbi:hypothetical protein AGDE_16892 [Angomonas deanei]|uniref:Lipase (Class 3), putative n=1 Tax=Angomonas deanei TaxID=59799 RepID=A0A7G2CQ37_9TRYP|nr:hypothetical protein AGDE_16892 [Angomonas deanei]CAD2221890.1 Lipase (class 3), putative [Angomonas deanei]|eukprot:EPY15961.1 hypothetical protein AGDE_16892 [Angomonas deanei]